MADGFLSDLRIWCFLFHPKRGGANPLHSQISVVQHPYLPVIWCSPRYCIWVWSIAPQKRIVWSDPNFMPCQAAYEKIRAGASLVEVYTGLVYKGPGRGPAQGARKWGWFMEFIEFISTKLRHCHELESIHQISHWIPLKPTRSIRFCIDFVSQWYPYL